MTSKKPPPAALTVVKVSTQPARRKNTAAVPANPRQQPDNRWQRSKRYGWDGR